MPLFAYSQCYCFSFRFGVTQTHAHKAHTYTTETYYVHCWIRITKMWLYILHKQSLACNFRRFRLCRIKNSNQSNRAAKDKQTNENGADIAVILQKSNISQKIVSKFCQLINLYDFTLNRMQNTAMKDRLSEKLSKQSEKLGVVNPTIIVL